MGILRAGAGFGLAGLVVRVLVVAGRLVAMAVNLAIRPRVIFLQLSQEATQFPFALARLGREFLDAVRAIRASGWLPVIREMR
jgi:hypothetical protein